MSDTNTHPKDVEIILPERRRKAGIIYQYFDDPQDDTLRLVLHYDGREITGVETDYFHAMQAIRRELDRDNILLCCYGASRNVYPSGMAMDMGFARKAFKCRIGEQARKADLVNIFDTGPDVIPSTVEDQEQFHNEWFNWFAVRWNMRKGD